MSSGKFNSAPKPIGNEPHTLEDHAIKSELTFEDKVVQKIIGLTLESVDGLLTVDGGLFSNITEKLVNTDDVTASTDTGVGKKQAAVDMDIMVECDKDIQNIHEKMKELISREVKETTHLDAIEVNVNAIGIRSKEEHEEDSEMVRDKVTGAARSIGEFASEQTEKAEKAVNKGTEQVKESMEPRVKQTVKRRK